MSQTNISKSRVVSATQAVRVSGRNVVATAAKALRNGQIAAFPTETVYGMGVRAGDAAARRRLAALKGRDPGKPFQFLLADARQAFRLAPDMPVAARRLAEEFWPGPLTLVVRDANGRWRGLRVPDHPVPRLIARRLGGAILATSANRAGEPPAGNAQEIAQIFGGKPILIVDGKGGKGQPSSVVKVWKRKWELLREGALSREMIARAIERRERNS